MKLNFEITKLRLAAITGLLLFNLIVWNALYGTVDMTVVLARLLSSATGYHPDQLQEGKIAVRCGNYEEATKVLQPLAEQHNAVAQFYLGTAYSGIAGQLLFHADTGFKTAAAYQSWKERVERDDKLGEKNRIEAEKWWRSAAEDGDARAQVEVGDLDYRRDPKEAAKWWRKAADQGNADARDRLMTRFPHQSVNKRELAEILATLLAFVFLPIVARNHVDWKNRLHVGLFVGTVILVLSPWIYDWSTWEWLKIQQRSEGICPSYKAP
jgi:hypothetical protein